MAVSLTIHVSDIESALVLYNVIKVKRSTTGMSGVYSDLTAVTPQHAVLQPPTGSPYNVSGEVMQIIVDSLAQENITFTGTNPLSAAQLVPQINTALGAVIATEVGGELVLTSTSLGTASKLTIVGGSSITDFGWTAGTKDVGEEAHIQLVAGQNLYGFTDNDGEESYFYKVQFLNTDNGLTSEESDPFQSEPGSLVPIGQRSLAVVNLLDGTGMPLEEQEISLYGVDEAFSVAGFQIPLTRKPITIVTDSSGHAEVSLVRGTRWRAVFNGTSFVREFVVPDETTFDLLSVMAVSSDPFEVAEPIYPAAPRRTL